jgi:hypothetical protein
MEETGETSYQQLLDTPLADITSQGDLNDLRDQADNYLKIVTILNKKGITNESDDVITAAELHNETANEDEKLDLEDEEAGETVLEDLRAFYNDKQLGAKLKEFIEMVDARAAELSKPARAKKTTTTSAEERSSGKGGRTSKAASSEEQSSSRKGGKGKAPREEEEAPQPSKKKGAAKSKAEAGRKEDAGATKQRRPAGSGGLQKVDLTGEEETVKDEKDINKMFTAVFWNMQKPGVEEQLRLDSEEPDLNKVIRSKLVKDATHRDYLTKYTPPEGRTYKQLFEANADLIAKLNNSNNKFSALFGFYGNDARFGLILADDASESLRARAERNPEDYVVDYKKYKQMVELSEKRVQVYEYWRKARGKKAKVPAVPTNFVKNYARYMLTPEAQAWVKAQTFRTPPKVRVDGFSDLKQYLVKELGLNSFEDSHLAKGEVTQGTMIILIYMALIREEITEEEVRQRKLAGIKVNAAKYGWSQAMIDTLGATPATWVRRKVDKSSGKGTDTIREANTTKQTVFDLLSAETKAAVKAQQTESGSKHMSPFYTTKDHLWSRNVNTFKEYLWDNSPATQKKNAKFFATVDKDNKPTAYLQGLATEAQAIAAFAQHSKEAVSDLKTTTKRRRSL